jgi:hypothetical protein
LYNPFESPSLEQIEEMERQQSQAVEALEISIPEVGEPRNVKCQRCGAPVPIVAKMSRPHKDRVVHLQTRLKWMENHQHICKKEDVEATKQELEELLQKDAKADKLQNLPLYSTRITGWKFVCS